MVKANSSQEIQEKGKKKLTQLYSYTSNCKSYHHLGWCRITMENSLNEIWFFFLSLRCPVGGAWNRSSFHCNERVDPRLCVESQCGEFKIE